MQSTVANPVASPDTLKQTAIEAIKAIALSNDPKMTSDDLNRLINPPAQDGFDAVNQAAQKMVPTGGKRSKFRLTHKNQNRKTRRRKTRGKK